MRVHPPFLQADPVGFSWAPWSFSDFAAKEGESVTPAKRASARTAWVVREATGVWTPSRHHLYHRGHRTAVRLLLLVATRLRNRLAAQVASGTPCSPPLCGNFDIILDHSSGLTFSHVFFSPHTTQHTPCDVIYAWHPCWSAAD